MHHHGQQSKQKDRDEARTRTRQPQRAETPGDRRGASNPTETLSKRRPPAEPRWAKKQTSAQPQPTKYLAPCRECVSATITLTSTALVAIIQAIPVQQTNDDEPIESEIFNGHDADRDEWPWTVLLKMGQFGGDICSGTLMSKRWVLTVATCVFDTFEIIAVVGEYDRLETNSSKEEIAVDKKILHPGFNIATLENNVALLRLSRNVVFNRKNIGRIPALSNETIDDQVKKNRGFPCYVAGWGYYIDDSGIWTLPSILQELKVRIIRNKRCNELRAGALLNTVTDDMVCYMAQRASTCAGDTGDPLMCYVNDEWTLIGVHCFKYDAIDGCRGGAKVAFRISAYRDWITSYVVRFSD